MNTQFKYKGYSITSSCGELCAMSKNITITGSWNYLKETINKLKK